MSQNEPSEFYRKDVLLQGLKEEAENPKQSRHKLTLFTHMKKIISKLFGVNFYATSKNVQGAKSVGISDANVNYKQKMKMDSSTGGRADIN